MAKCEAECPYEDCTGKCYLHAGHLDEPGRGRPGEGNPKNPHWCWENIDHTWLT